jgi:uncharacterized membrane protein YsdA (DUF1294 family)
MPKRRPKRTFLGIAALLAVALSVLLWWLDLPVLYAYLGGINVATILLYGYDKRQAIAGGGRVPEVVLHLVALIGGSPGALVAQVLFRHKTRKFTFRLVFVGIILVQGAVIFSYWLLSVRGT